MLNEFDRERIRRGFYVEKKSIYRLIKETGYSHQTIEKVLSDAPAGSYRLTRPKPAPVFGPYQARVDALLEEKMPHKQRYTAHKIFEIISAEGYQGSESRVRQYLSTRKKANQPPEVFLPLEFEPGHDAQVDWGEAVVELGGKRQKVQFFLMRLCYSRRALAMAYPSQAQECFLYAHLQAFKHFGGVPHRISYDNLGTAVKLVFDESHKRGRRRKEVRAFVAFRSHYLFESHFCQPGIEGAHEKGGVEHGIGYTRRQLLVPVPSVPSFEELNQLLYLRCLKEDARTVARQTQTIGSAWEQERTELLPLPPSDYECCDMTTVRLTPYSQVTYQTNRYSVPVDRAHRDVTVKAYPFQVEVWKGTEKLCSHPRCYGREQDIFDPLHYLELLARKPGAFDYAKPLKQWKAGWPPSYHRMLAILREKWPEGRGVAEFIRILMLHEHYDTRLVEQAIEQALASGYVHLDGVQYCLHQLMEQATKPAEPKQPLSLADRPDLANIGTQPVDLSRYEQLLKLSW